MAADEFVTEQVAPDQLRPHPDNFLSHPEDQLVHIIESIREHGIYRPVVVAADYTILAGHGVTQAALKMGLKSLPVKKMDYGPQDPRAYKLLAADNTIAFLAERDDRKLSEVLKIVQEFDAEKLLGTGFDEQMLANLVFVSRPATEIADFDAAAHWVGMPEYEEEKKPWQIIINFEHEEDREKFEQEFGFKMMKKYETSRIWSMRWPDMERENPSALKFEAQDE